MPYIETIAYEKATGELRDLRQPQQVAGQISGCSYYPKFASAHHHGAYRALHEHHVFAIAIEPSTARNDGSGSKQNQSLRILHRASCDSIKSLLEK